MKIYALLAFLVGFSIDAMDPIKKKSEETVTAQGANALSANSFSMDQARLNNLLMQEITNGRAWRVQALLQCGAQANQKDSQGKTPLMYAAGTGNIAVALALIRKDAKVHAKDNHNNSALHYALLKDPSVVDNSPIGKRKLQDIERSKSHYHPGMADLLLRNGMACCNKNEIGMNPFTWMSHRSIRHYGKLCRAFLRNRMHCPHKSEHDSIENEASLNRILSKIIESATISPFLRPFIREREATSGNEEPLADCTLVLDVLCAGADMVPAESAIKTIEEARKERFDSLEKAQEDFSRGSYWESLWDTNLLHSFDQFQGLHKDAIVQSLKQSIPATLYPLIYECLYIRPRKGIMPAHLRDLLMAPKNDVRATQLIKKYIMMGGDVNATDVLIASDDKTQSETTAITPMQKLVKSKRTMHNTLSLAIRSGNNQLVCFLGDNDAHLPGSPANEACEIWLRAFNAGHMEIAHDYHSRMMNTMGAILRSGEIEVLVDLFNRGMPVNIFSEDNNKNLLLILLDTALPDPAQNNPNFLRKVKFLIERGINLNTVGSPLPRNALQFAVENEFVDAVKLLLYMGARDDRTYASGKTLWETTGHEGIKQLLKNPSNIATYLTDQEKTEFADIKTKRERSLAQMKAQSQTAAAK